jgi:hypothetical protein
MFFGARQWAALDFPDCIKVQGSLVTYAYEGVAGAPRRAIHADHVEPVSCPRSERPASERD